MNKRNRVAMSMLLVGAMAGSMAAGVSAEELKSSRDTLTIAVEGTIAHLDAIEGVVNQSQNVYSVVGESLLKEVKNEEGLPVMTTEGSITESYEVDEENSGILYHLKQGVMMHDGTELNAEDVVTSVKHMESGTYYADVNYDNVYAVDDYTAFVGLTQVGMPVINKVSTIPIFSKEAYEEVNNDGLFFTEDYVSCGQYKITDWVAGDSVTVEAFDDYFGGKAPINKVIYRIFSETSVAMMELQTGGVDVVMSPDFQTYTDIVGGNYGDMFTAEESVGNMLYCVYLNMNSEKLQDFRVRQAIMYALNREDIGNGTFDGAGKQAYRILGATYDGMTDYDETSWPYQQNIEKAKELMAEAGYADGMDLTLISHNANNYYQTIGEIFANQVKEIGINVTIQVYEPATFKSTQNGLEGWDVSTTSPNTSYVTNASDFLNNALIGSMHCDARPTEGYDEVAEILTTLKSETDEAKVVELSKQFEDKYFNELLWWYPVQLSSIYTVYNADLEGFDRCMNCLNLGKAYFK